MKDAVMMILTSAVGTVGFCVIFQMKPKRLPFAAFGAMLTCAAYLAAAYLGAGTFLSNFIPAFLSAAYSEICARLLKAPASVFLTASIVPLVPGSNLYYAMSALISQQYTVFWDNMLSAIIIALGVSGGIIMSSVLAKIIFRKKSRVF